MWSYPLSRVEQYFPVSSSEPATVLLLNPAQDSSVPPLDLLKLSTFLQSRGYATRLQKGVQNNAPEEPYAVVLTSVFSWEVPDLRRAVNDVCRLWPRARRILSGVLPRRLGDQAKTELDVSILDEASEALLDEQIPDYTLAPEWDASVVITSKGICPRECSHCATAFKGKGVTRLIRNWRLHLNADLPRVEVWDNTLMLTPREHFTAVAQVLEQSQKPVDLVCGLVPNGVEETELFWRIDQLAGVQLRPARLECNKKDELPRFFRLLARARNVFGDRPEYRAFAVINGSESPVDARTRIDRLRAEGVQVELVCFTPHDWEHRRRFVNHAAGWAAEDLLTIEQDA